MKMVIVCGSGAHAVCVIASFEEAVRHGLAKIVWLTAGERASTLYEYSWTRTLAVPLDPASCKLFVAEHVVGKVDHVGVCATTGRKFVACAGRSVYYDALVFALDPTEDLLSREFLGLYGSPLPVPDRLANRSSLSFNIYSPFSMRELAAFVSNLKPRDYLRASVGESPATRETVPDDSDEEEDDDDDVELSRPVCIDLVLPAAMSKLCERLCATSKHNDPKLLHFAAHDTERSLELVGKDCNDSEVVRVFSALSDTYLHVDAHGATAAATFLRDIKSIRLSHASATDIAPLVQTMFLTAAGTPVSSWLRALTVEHTVLDAVQLEALCSSFSDISRLESLTLRSVGMQPSHAPLVAVALKRLRHCLVNLDVSGNALGPQGVALVLQTLPTASLVRSLALSGVRATDACVPLITSCLPQLETVDLSSNSFGDEFALQLGESVRSLSCPRLRSLNLEDNPTISIAGVAFLLKCVVVSSESTLLTSLQLKGCAAIGVHEAPFAASVLACKRTERFSTSIIASEAKCLDMFLGAIQGNLTCLDINLVEPAPAPTGRFDPALRQAPSKASLVGLPETLARLEEAVKKNCAAAAARTVSHAVASREKPLYLLDAAAAAAAATARPDDTCVVLRITDKQEEVFASQENFFEHEMHRVALFEALVDNVTCPNVVFRCGTKGRAVIQRLRYYCDATVTALQPSAPAAVKRIATLPFIYNLPQVDDRYYLNEKLCAFMIGPGCSAKHTDVMSVYSAVGGSLSFFAMHLMPHLVAEVLRKLCPQLVQLKTLLGAPERLHVLLHHDFRLARRQLAANLATNTSSEAELRAYAQRHKLAALLNAAVDRVQALAPASYEGIVQQQRRYALSLVEASAGRSVEPAAAAGGKEKGGGGGEKKKKDGGDAAAATAPAVAALPPPEVPATDTWSVVAQVLQEHCLA